MQPILRLTDHRPWPLPSSPWIMQQKWHDLLFAHWSISADKIRPLIPNKLELDLFDGHAWIGVVPFWMSGVRFRWMFSIPSARTFPELNVRTYVRGGKERLPGVYFFSLDAASLFAVCGAQLAFHLPYFWSRMRVTGKTERTFEYECRRRDHKAEFRATYHPIGAEFIPRKSTLEYFLTERYCLYTTNRKCETQRCNIHHAPWRLHVAEAEIHRNSMAKAAGIDLPVERPLLHYAEPQVVVVWPLESV